MLTDVAEVLLLVMRGALLAGLSWGVWLCLGARAAAPRLRDNRPLAP